MYDVTGLTKENNWIEVWLTGMDLIRTGTGDAPFNLTTEFYDFEKDRFENCRMGKTQTCPYPFFVGIVEGDFDLRCWSKMLKNNFPKVTA